MFKNTFMILLVVFFIGCDSKNIDLPTVEKVELNKYIGSWHEIARFEHFFEKGCKNVSATYELKDDGNIKVINRCQMIETNKKKEVTGVAYAIDETNSKLKVSFFRPFYGDYWIIELADDYSYSVVGAPNREYLWILSRTKILDNSIIEDLLPKISALGFDTNKFIWTIQE